MGWTGRVRRHRARVASGSALLLTLATVLTYALTAEGYRSHEAELNDGGVWVVNGAKGWSGRMNKPINQFDGIVAADTSQMRMDVLQDGAAVVVLDLDGRHARTVEPARLTTIAESTLELPGGGDIAMGGGTLATLAGDRGEVRAARYDATSGKPTMAALAADAPPLGEAGEASVLAVTTAGTVVAASAERSMVTTITAAGSGHDEPVEEALGDGAGKPDQVTAVGEQVVTLDSARGALQVLGGPATTVPANSVLQQAGPTADAVLLASGTALLEVDLDSGKVSTVGEAAGAPIAPVRLGACRYGAWSGGDGQLVVQCGSDPTKVRPLGGAGSGLEFRVNRGEIVLNDAVDGAVWDVEQARPIRIDNWQAFTQRKKEQDKEKKSQDQTDSDRRPPKARPDSYGVRAGRSTVLHPLDNDSAPRGRLLSITQVDRPTNGAEVTISPDGQSLVVRVPERAASTTFDYHIDDGRKDLAARAQVRVAVRGQAENSPPALRKGEVASQFDLANGGAMAIPVLADWRDDDDGDPLLLESATVAGNRDDVKVRTTSDGRVRLATTRVPGAAPRTVRVDYAVSDGRSAPVTRSLDFRVQGYRDTSGRAPVAEPDVVRGQVDQPIRIRPLLNDLPGSDPAVPDAELALGGKLAQQPGTTVLTDLDGGKVTFTAEKPGTYFLDYDAAFGGAPTDRGTIRVDVSPRPRRTPAPVAMPDTLTVFGQSPAMVDVLANDLDPAGGLLVVERATPGTPGALDVAVVDGRWLRVSSRRPDLAPATQTVTYSISNGAQSGVQGELVVTQRPVPADNTPITVADRAVVRAGSLVSVPVLDNDTSPSGDRLTLLNDLGEGAAGRLEVTTESQVGEVGSAHVSGRQVRYVAPDVAERTTVQVPYVAANQAGERAEGVLHVTVVPDSEDNRAPEPPMLEGRVVAGDRVRVSLPGVGVDPDGDAVTVTGITSAPGLGRIVSTGGNSVEYQAYPRTAGTDEFEYAVVDSRGAFATGTARVVVVAPGEPQPPLAVADRMSVQPGRTAVLDPMANDFVAAGDRVRVELLAAPEGVELDRRTNLVRIQAPTDLESASVQVVYRLTNGITESRSTMTLDLVEQHNNPPVVPDAFGRVSDGDEVEVDVLAEAYDPDGDEDDVQVVEVMGDAEAQVLDSRTIRVPRGEQPKVLPFRVVDADGGEAVASVYVPPSGDALPHVKDEALLEVDEGGSWTGDVADLVVAPPGTSVRLVPGSESVSASPAGLSATRDGAGRVTVRAQPGFRGPGALLVEVTTARDEAGNEDSTTIGDGVTALLSVPVQVGDDVPTLSCPDASLPLAPGQRAEIDIATVCKVWTLDPRDATDLDYRAGWSSAPDGVEVEPLDGSVVAVTVPAGAEGGSEAVLEVRAGDSEPDRIRFRLTAPPPPTLAQVPVEDMRAGQTRSIDLAPYLRAGVAEPEPTVVSVEPLRGSGVEATSSGSVLTLRAGDDASGRIAFRVVVSDVDTADPPASRRAEARIEFEVGGVPGRPGTPSAIVNAETRRAALSWDRPRDDGGARITSYEVREVDSGEQRTCPTTQCTFRNLPRADEYSFQVRAVNKVGPGAWSGVGRARASVKPGLVTNIRAVSVGDGTLTVGWTPPRRGAGQLTGYQVRHAGRWVEVGPSARQHRVGGLDNNRTYVFEVRAITATEVGEVARSRPLQSVGTPVAPRGVGVSDLQTGTESTTVQVRWAATLPEGPGPVTYTVRATRGAGASSPVAGCVGVSSRSCNHAGVTYDGSTVTYTVTATNGRDRTSRPSSPAVFRAAGRPAAWGSWTVTATGRDQQARVQAVVPDPRGSAGKVAIVVDGRVVRQVTARRGQSLDERFGVPTNDRAATVQLRLCNESRQTQGCSETTTASVQTFGPLADSHIRSLSAVVNGKSITWQVSGTSNGNAAMLGYRIDGAPEQVDRLHQPGEFTWGLHYEAENYRQTIPFEIRLFDDEPGGRGQGIRSIRSRTDDPPPPDVTVSRGAACRDGGTTPCQSGPTQPVCDVAGCARVRVQLSGWEHWENAPTCRVSIGSRRPWFQGRTQVIPQNDTPLDTEWYSPGGQVRVTCDGGGTSASGTASW